MPSNVQLLGATLAQLRGWFIEGTLTPAIYLDFCFAQIERLNPDINAVLDVYRDTATSAAKAATQRYAEGQQKSAIDGMPIGVKANIAVQDQVCNGGIKAYDTHIATHDADIVRRLRRAGAVIIGSLNMEEGALGAQTDNPWFGKTQNPVKSGYTPGGSSGGSAAAVAAGMMPASLGTDTMGSVRIPSAYCGLVGFKPSPDTYSTDGVMPLSTTLDTVGTHTRTVQDAAMIYRAVTEFEGPVDPLAPLNMSTCDVSPFDISGSDVDPDIRAAFKATLDALPANVLNPVLAGYDYGQQRRAGLILSEFEGANFHSAKDFANSGGFSDHFKSMLLFGRKQSSATIEAARTRLLDAEMLAEQLFENTAALIAPTAPQTAFRFGDDVPANQADFTAFANFARLPAISLPMGLDNKGLPMGFQIMAKAKQDQALLGMALTIEASLKP